MCQSLIPYLIQLSIHVGAITMVIISYDSYCMILHPAQNKNKMQFLSPRKLLVLIWFSSAVFSLPYAITVEAIALNYQNMTLLCQEKQLWTNFDPDKYMKFVQIEKILVQYLIPIIAMTFCYTKIIYHLIKQKCIGENVVNQMKQRKKKRMKTIKILITVMIIYIICWLPYHSYNAFLILMPQRIEFCKQSKLLFFLECLASTCGLFNIIIYWWMSEQFRSDAKKLILKISSSGDES